MKKSLVNLAGAPTTRLFLLTMAFVATAHLASAETATAGLEKAATGIKSMWPSVKNIMLVVMAVMGLIGAGSVYSKWSNGDPDTRKAAASWFGALIFAGLVLTILSAVFKVE